MPVIQTASPATKPDWGATVVVCAKPLVTVPDPCGGVQTGSRLGGMGHDELADGRDETVNLGRDHVLESPVCGLRPLRIPASNDLAHEAMAEAAADSYQASVEGAALRGEELDDDEW
jgi:hypothetical protein